jgi:hypothetical protein
MASPHIARLLLAPALTVVAACGGERARPASPVAGGSASAGGGSSAAPSATPCLPGPPLLATDLYQRLEKHAWSLYASEDEPPPPPSKLGSCTVERNVIRAADGAVVAELGCGVRVLQRGIRDDLGLEIGALGRDVLARKPRPVPALTCIPNGPDQARCAFERAPDKDVDSSWYVVAGKLDETVTGDAAIAFFAPRTLVELDVSVWCH